MAGHSKWANIKRRKGAQDAKRGKLFTKLIKEITVAARMGGGDIETNPRLRLAIDKAKAVSMPKDNIQRAVDKGSGNVDMADFDELVMEGYGPGGAAVLVEVLTDNRNRSASEIRFAFNKGSGNLGTSGCVAYLFNRKGVITGPAEGVDEDDLMMVALDAGAEDFSIEGEGWEVVSSLEDFAAVRDALEASDLEVESADLSYIPDTQVTLEGKDAEQFLRLLDLLDDCDDVQNVHHNADISDEELERIAGE